MTEPALIHLESVSKTYKLGQTTVQALQQVNLAIKAGDITAIMGPSGSGKSTLLNLMGALDLPSHGTVTVKTAQIGAMTRDQLAAFRNEAIGFVFQNFNLIPVLTTLENVMLPAQLGRVDQNMKNRAEELLDKVGLAPQKNQSVNRLSGGQMQRVAIARALMNKPSIILADEPTANLDHETADNILAILRDTCREEGATVIIATHDQAVLPYCQRVIHMRDGRVISNDKV